MNRLQLSARYTLAALVLIAPLILGVTPSASAAKRHTFVYDALGDSYAAGYGVPPYSPDACSRSQSAYAVQVDGRVRLSLDDFVACSGATTASLVSGGQLNALDADTDVVTVSVGGNDIKFSEPVVACLYGNDQQCAGQLGLTLAKVTGVLPGLLDSVYGQMAAAAPNAHVFVIGYPRLFSPQYGPYLNASPAEQQALNDGADLLSSVIATAAADHGFTYVDVTKRFSQHGMNAPDAWIIGPPSAPGALHPNAEGYQAYTAAVTAAIRPGQLR